MSRPILVSIEDVCHSASKYPDTFSLFQSRSSTPSSVNTKLLTDDSKGKHERAELTYFRHT